MDLSVLVVSYNTRDLLAGCLASIEPAVPGIDCEVLVVDNGSVDGSAEMVASDFPRVRLIRNTENQGFARANNQAIRASSGRYVLLLNSDAVLLPGTLAAMIDFLEGNPGVAAVGGRLLNPDGTFQASFADFPSLLSEFLLMTKLSSLVHSHSYPSYSEDRSLRERPVDWVFGACMMVRRTAIDGVGALDEDFFMYTEETDWCYRMRKAGWLVFYLPGAKTVHLGGQSASRVPERKRSQLYRSKGLFIRKHHGALAARAFSLLLCATSSAKLVLWGLTALASRGAGRERAWQQSRSYLLLLSEL